MPTALSVAQVSELRSILPSERITSDPAELTVYGYDGTWLERRPDVAVSVASADEVAGVLERQSSLLHNRCTSLVMDYCFHKSS